MKDKKKILQQLEELESKLLKNNIVYMCIGKELKPKDSKDKTIFHMDI